MTTELGKLPATILDQNIITECSTCGHKEYITLHAEGWLYIKVDCSKAVCIRCRVLEAPEDWHDYRCTGCNGWFNVSRKIFDDEPRPKVETQLGPVCLPCAECLLAEHEESAT